MKNDKNNAKNVKMQYFGLALFPHLKMNMSIYVCVLVCVGVYGCVSEKRVCLT